MTLTLMTWLRVGSVLIVATLAGCGGGGSTSGVAAPSQGVTVGPPTPAKVVSASKIVGEAMANVQLTGSLSGDVTSLQNKPLFVTVVDPDRLFDSSASVTVQNTASGWIYAVNLIGRVQSAASHVTGNLQIFACLDAACTQPLAGTPFLVPYDVTIEGGATLSRSDITVSVPFGTLPAPELVNVTMSPNVTLWNVSNSNSLPAPSRVTASKSTTTANQLQVQLAAAPPGTYNETVTVISSGATSARSFQFEKTITVHYTVTPNPALDYVFWPAPRFDLTISAADPLVHVTSHQLVLNTGVTMNNARTVEYLTTPGTTGPATSWWDLYTDNAYYACVGNSVGPPSCLTPGLYVAQSHYHLMTPTGARDVLFPITLKVTP